MSPKHNRMSQKENLMRGFYAGVYFELILAILSVLSLLVCEILSDSVLSREELAACIYWNEFDFDRCYPGYHKCGSSRSGCCPCQPGSFMAWNNKCSQCLPFRDCPGSEILFGGNFMNDRVCGGLHSTTVSTPTETTVSLSSSSSPDLAIDQTTDSSIYSIIDEGTPWFKFDLVTALSFITIAMSCVIGYLFWKVYIQSYKTQGPCTCQCVACKSCTGAYSTHKSAHPLIINNSENPDPPSTDMTKSPADMELPRNRKRSNVAIPVVSQFTMPTKQTEANHYIKE